ncbi:uncharacterized protein LOC108680484 isoform X2 [Hyalella azteca]|uniref:Uncharacterized protein LOC108680484 isoform X2 n=1 Tax=Hyalella azteca TaxID=294128 RepID=A0A8B7PGW1_HYAAZ|nr:uncharacterized protein LOC108680484 isoform X2 [Hyalella azteca]
MFSRIFGKSRRSPPLTNGDDFEIVDPDAASSDGQQFTIEGAAAFRDAETDVAPSPSAVTVRSISHEDPTFGVPFKLTIEMDPASGSSELSEAMAVVARIQTIDWDQFDYNFKLEQNVLDECGAKLQNSMLDIINNEGS